MSDRRKQDQAQDRARARDGSQAQGGTEPQDRGRIKDPEDWTTGDEPMTGAQASYLETLAREAGEESGEDLTKAEASKKIDELKDETGR